MKSRTWKALQELVLDANDSRSVNRYEKLSKLMLTLLKGEAVADPTKVEVAELRKLFAN